jgi:hypothetical protein
MPFVLLAAGAVLLIATARGTQQNLYTLLQGDFTGPNNFVYWFVSILAIGALGYVKGLKPIANTLLALVIVVLFLRRGGFFTQFTSALSSTQTATPSTAQTSTTNVLGSLVPNITGTNNVGSILATPPILSSGLPSLPTLTPPTVSDTVSTTPAAPPSGSIFSV